MKITGYLYVDGRAGSMAIKKKMRPPGPKEVVVRLELDIEESKYQVPTVLVRVPAVSPETATVEVTPVQEYGYGWAVGEGYLQAVAHENGESIAYELTVKGAQLVLKEVPYEKEWWGKAEVWQRRHGVKCHMNDLAHKALVSPDEEEARGPTL